MFAIHSKATNTLTVVIVLCQKRLFSSVGWWKGIEGKSMSENISNNEALASPGNESFEKLLDAMQKGEDWAWTKFFEDHYEYLVQRVKWRISSYPLPVGYGVSDIAQTGMKSFVGYIKSKDRRTLDLHDNLDLLRILITTTMRKLCNKYRAQKTIKRGGEETVFIESAFARMEEDGLSPLEQGRKPGLHESLDERLPFPAYVELIELIDWTQKNLPDGAREVLDLLLQGYSKKEIEKILGVTTHTIRLRCDAIRELLENEEKEQDYDEDSN